MPTNTKQQLCIKPTGFLVFVLTKIQNLETFSLIFVDYQKETQ